MSRRRSKLLKKEVYPSSVHSAEDVAPRSSPPPDLLGVCQRVVAQGQAELFAEFTVDLFNATVFLQVFNDLDSKCLKAKFLCLVKTDSLQDCALSTSVRQVVLEGTGYVLYAPPCLFYRRAYESTLVHSDRNVVI